METEEATQEDLDAALEEPHLSGNFMRKLALVIVAAHPTSQKKSDKQRVNDALRALLGDTYKPDSKRTNITEALVWMADAYMQDQTTISQWKRRKKDSQFKEVAPKIRDQKELAVEASRRVSGAPSAETLENEFSASKKNWLMAAALRSDIPGTIHKQGIQQICKILNRFKVSTDIDAIY